MEGLTLKMLARAGHFVSGERFSSRGKLNPGGALFEGENTCPAA